MPTKRQQEIYDFVVRYAEKTGYPPTVREIGEAIGLASPSTVHAHLANLEREGYLKRDPTKPRALGLVGPDAASPRRETATSRSSAVGEAIRSDGGAVRVLPLVGRIAAGGPLLAEENVEDYVAVPEPLSRGDEEFLLRVRGESMTGAGILPDDFVVVRRQATAENGDVVVALVGEDEAADEATVKRFFRESGRIRLQPENAAMAPLYPEHVQILGKVIGVFRRL